jgi:hypothetical protein
MKKFMILAILTMMATNENADLTGNELLRMDKLSQMNTIISTINGSIATTDVLKMQPTFCEPEGVTHEQEFNLVMKYIKNNPEIAHLYV